MPTQLTSGQLAALTTCSHCGSRDVDMICVPGGWMQLVCQCCLSDWWVENKTVRLPDPAARPVSATG